MPCSVDSDVSATSIRCTLDYLERHGSKQGALTMQPTPTIMYAMPKNGFLPPRPGAMVESTTDFVPPNEETG